MDKSIKLSKPIQLWDMKMANISHHKCLLISDWLHLWQ